MKQIDTILNLHQSLNFEYISKANVEILNHSLKNNVKLKELTKQLSEVSDANKQILQNQITEIEKVEKQKALKNLSFFNRQITNEINEIKNSFVKYYFSSNHLQKIKRINESAISDLIEINDKEYCSQTKRIITQIENEIFTKKVDYESSDFSQLKNLIEDYNNKTQNSTADNIKKFDSKKKRFRIGKYIILLLLIFFTERSINGTIKYIKLGQWDGILGFLTILLIFSGLLFYFGKREYNWVMSYNEKLNKLQKIRDNHTEKLKNHPLHELIKKLNIDYPEFANISNSILILEKEFRPK